MQASVVITEACPVLIDALGVNDLINGWRVDLVLQVIELDSVRNREANVVPSEISTFLTVSFPLLEICDMKVSLLVATKCRVEHTLTWRYLVRLS